MTGRNVLCFNESKIKECFCVFDSFYDLLSPCLCVYRVLTGWGRTPRWDLTACGGKTGTTMKRSKEMHLDPVGPSILRDIYSSDTQCSVIHKKDSHLHTQSYSSLGLIALQQRCKSVLECSFCCCICYNNHQLQVLFSVQGN